MQLLNTPNLDTQKIKPRTIPSFITETAYLSVVLVGFPDAWKYFAYIVGLHASDTTTRDPLFLTFLIHSLPHKYNTETVKKSVREGMRISNLFYVA